MAICFSVIVLFGCSVIEQTYPSFFTLKAIDEYNQYSESFDIQNDLIQFLNDYAKEYIQQQKEIKEEEPKVESKNVNTEQVTRGRFRFRQGK